MWDDLEHSLRRSGIEPETIWDFESEENPTQRKLKSALKKISSNLKNGSLSEKKYLIIVVDNIDQSPIDCQSHCLTFVQDIIQIDSGVDTWKIIFPCWPQTLSKLRRESGMTVKETEYCEIVLGHLDLPDFYKRKLDYLIARYKLEDGKSQNEKAARILDEVSHLANTVYKDTLRDITYGNFLNMDALIVRMLQSEELAQHEAREKWEHLSDYRFFDSLITGINEL